MKKICVKCGRKEDCETTMASIISMLKLMEVPYVTSDDEMYIVVPDDVVPYIMALAGVGLWAELRGRAEPC